MRTPADTLHPVTLPTAAQAHLRVVPEMMRAVQIVQPQQAIVIDAPTPEPGDDEVFVKIEGCGLCGSNLPVWEGRDWFQYPLPPGNPGHEAWGHIVALGKDAPDSLQPGDRVAMLSYAGFAGYDIAKSNAVVQLPPALDGQPFPGEPLSCAYNVFARTAIQPGQTVAICRHRLFGRVAHSPSSRRRRSSHRHHAPPLCA